ncbi:MAG: FHA domain-containing protein [Acidobacteriota bacterium]|nr:FHA domain-containing protein [Acidobacteriota bacterium]
MTEIQPEIDLTGVDTHRSVSRRHSRLTRSSEGWMVAEEVGALNGTFVNGVRLAPGQQVLLRDGDVVSFGMVRVVYREAE